MKHKYVSNYTKECIERVRLNAFPTSIFVGSNFADLLQNSGPTEAPFVGLKTNEHQTTSYTQFCLISQQSNGQS